MRVRGAATVLAVPLVAAVVLGGVANASWVNHGTGATTLTGTWSTTLPAPAGFQLVCQDQGNDRVDASWLAVTGATSYNVEYTDAYLYNQIQLDTGLTGVTDVAQLPEDQYEYVSARVQAVKSGVDGTWSAYAAPVWCGNH